jgi:hypothetical protein
VVKLVQVMLAGEDGAVGQHLRQDAAHGPDVDGLCVTLKYKTWIRTRSRPHNGTARYLIFHWLQGAPLKRFYAAKPSHINKFCSEKEM